MVYFYFTFWAPSPPYVPFVPLAGVGEQLFFPGGRSDQRNRALVDLRLGPRGLHPRLPARDAAAVPVAAQHRDVDERGSASGLIAAAAVYP